MSNAGGPPPSITKDCPRGGTLLEARLRAAAWRAALNYLDSADFGAAVAGCAEGVVKRLAKDARRARKFDNPRQHCRCAFATRR